MGFNSGFKGLISKNSKCCSHCVFVFCMDFRTNSEFNVHESVHRKYVLLYIQQDATLHCLFYMETAVHVSGGTNTHHQERKQLYLQHLVFVTPLLLPAAMWKSWNWSECAVGGVHHPQHTQTRCCRYSCMRS